MTATQPHRHTASPSQSQHQPTPTPTPPSQPPTIPKRYHRARQRVLHHVREGFRATRKPIRNVLRIVVLGYAVYMLYDFDDALLKAEAFLRSSLSFTIGTIIAIDYKILHWRWVARGYESKEYKDEREVVHKRAARILLWLASKQGGIYVKAAQHLASLRYIVPDPFVDTLQQLQDRAPFRRYKVVRRMIREEFGAEPQQLFREFAEMPFAAASLAQVHEAITKDGEKVAVKIQYPDVARLFTVDITTMKIISILTTFFFEEFNLDWIVEEFKQNLIQEFDFEKEGRNCELTDARFAHRAAEIRCPRIRWDLTKKRILTMEFVDGIKVNDIEGLRKAGLTPEDLGRLITEAAAEMLFCHGVVHVDLHPGNMLCVPSPQNPKLPQLVILDHGLYKVLDEGFRHSYCLLWKAMVTNDIPLLRRSAIQLGVGNYFQYFPLLFIGRPVDGKGKLGSGMNEAEQEQARQNLKNIKMGDIFEFLEALPRDMLFSLRVGNLTRSIHRELLGENSPRQRFAINARYAVKEWSQLTSKNAADFKSIDAQLLQLSKELA
ncbi:hypothetical protein SeLEV6574_g05532 [Synchytrium endobioticum]|uniref:ABC1 atypical kinase-like domain-containing protein n=1 Tax=Synchytrium endobioticum TaxID=286115 RepID=A0A507CU77_9FUNG|nr:hypothetical protein SeLEV6574_g05532 [Synchytrium endobioticum]